MIELAPVPRKKPGEGWHIGIVTADYTQWQKGHLCALSSVVMIEDEHQPAHWEWIISFSKMGRARLTNEEIKICLKAFGAEDFEEDNHEPGIARKFWLAVDPQFRKPCPCKDEEVITEGEYQYSVKKESHER